MRRAILLHRLSIIITTAGLSIILIWIGIFKFTPTEANGIVDLVKNSPLMGWMYGLFSVQTTSDIIGVFEIVTGLLLATGLYSPKLGVVGSSLSIVIFFTTSTFMLSTPGAFAEVDGIWVPSGLGSFLIKDITALGASLFLLSHYLQKMQK